MTSWEFQQVSYIDSNVLLLRTLLIHQQHVTDEEIRKAKPLINKPRIHQKFLSWLLFHFLFYVTCGSHHLIFSRFTSLLSEFVELCFGLKRERMLGFCVLCGLRANELLSFSPLCRSCSSESFGPPRSLSNLLEGRESRLIHIPGFSCPPHTGDAQTSLSSWDTSYIYVCHHHILQGKRSKVSSPFP